MGNDMNNIFYVYQLRIDGDSLPFYVGKGQKKRAWNHFTPAKLKEKSYKNNTIKQAHREGKQILVEFIKTGLSEVDSWMWEVFWIAEYGRADLGYGPLTNHTDGGEGESGKVYSQESKDKISKAHKGKILSEETKNRISEGLKGIFLGRPLAEETKRKLSEAHTGKTLSEEHKVKLSKEWIVYHPDGREERVTNLQKFCDANGLDSPTLRRTADGKAKQHKGFRCARIPE